MLMPYTALGVQSIDDGEQLTLYKVINEQHVTGQEVSVSSTL